jgi:hypothetical protein
LAVAEGSSGRGEYPFVLEYPQGWSESERAAARERLKTLPAALAQQLLDEFASHLASGSIRGPPLAYLRALVARAQAGTFVPEAAVQVATRRQQQRQTEARLRQADEAHRAALIREGHAIERAGDSALARRVAAIRNRALRGKRRDP